MPDAVSQTPLRDPFAELPHNEDAPTLRAENVGFSYRAGQTILQDVNLTLERGSFTFLTGPSGAGKSSLLGILSLILRPVSGRLLLNGTDVSQCPREALPGLRQRIGMVYQDFRLIDHLTVEENVGLPLKIADESESVIAPKVRELVAWVGLKDHLKVRPPVLSGGQKQRVAIARAVITAPDLILADEPSGNLDPALSLRFMYLFEELNKSGTTVLYATHDAELVARFRYPALRLKDGTLHQTGSLQNNAA